MVSKTAQNLKLPATEVVFYPACLPCDWNKRQTQFSRVMQYVTDPHRSWVSWLGRKRAKGQECISVEKHSPSML